MFIVIIVILLLLLLLLLLSSSFYHHHLYLNSVILLKATTATKKFKYQSWLFLKQPSFIYTESLSSSICNTFPYKNKYVNPKFIDAQLTNKVLYTITFFFS